MIFEIPNPKAAHYQLTLPNLGGKYEYNVQRVSSQAIEFTHSFIYQRSVRKNSLQFLLPPRLKVRLYGQI